MGSKDSNTDRESPEDRAGIISRLFFCWVQPLISQGRRQPLQTSDLYPLSKGTACGPLADSFEQIYYSLKTRDDLWLLKRWKWVTVVLAIGRVVGWRYWTYCISFRLMWSAFALGQVYALRAIVERVTRVDGAEGNGRSLWVYLLVAFGMFLAALAQGVSLHANHYHGVRGGLKAQVSLSAAVYRKAMKLSLPSVEEVTKGQIGNLLICDVQRLFRFVGYWHFIWFAVLDLVVISVLLYIDLGRAALFGVLIIFLLLPLQLLSLLPIIRARKRAVLHADNRVQVMGEVLQGIRAVKLSAWEPYFHGVIADKRRREIRCVLFENLNTAVTQDLFQVIPIFITLAMFLCHTLLFGNTLTPALAFSTQGLFNVLRLILIVLPYGGRDTAEVLVSLKRIDRFLSLPELPKHAADELMGDTEDKDASASGIPEERKNDQETKSYSLRVLISEGDFAWSLESRSQRLRSKTSLPLDSVESCSPTSTDVKHIIHRGENSGKLLMSSLSAPGITTAASTDAKLGCNGLVLRGIDFEARAGDLICIVGAVGSGKTSLLLAILRELVLVRGRLCTFGSVAYCAQQPWIMNGTVRENVTVFGKKDEPIDQAFYNRIIDACCFRDDLHTFPAGDETEIGERGINLSGGQKARLALCRALYSDADLFLLDDPLSAVDTIVGKQIKERVLGRGGILANKCRVVATHQSQLLPESSRIVVLGQGKCLASGTYEELVRSGLNLVSLGMIENDTMGEQHCQWNQKEDASSILPSRRGTLYEKTEESGDSVDQVESSLSAEELIAPGSPVTFSGENAQPRKTVYNGESESARAQLVTKEDRRVGRVAWRVYRKYAQATGGIWALLSVMTAYTISEAARQTAEWWLAAWSTDARDRIKDDGFGPGNRFYGLVFMGLAFTTVVLFVLRACLAQERAAAASRHLHDRLLERILYATPTFFESNPVGRILNRFSQDMDQVDNPLPHMTGVFLSIVFMNLAALVMISWILPWALLALAPLFACFWLFQHWYVLSSRELKRLDGISKSPIYAQYTETMSGLMTVRAFRSQEQFKSLFEKRVNANLQAATLFWNASRWVGSRLDFLAACFVLATSVIIISISGKVSPGLAGVALSQSLLLTGVFQWAVRLKTECENFFTSVERVTAMTAEAPIEAPPIIADNRPEPSWPSEGVIEFDGVVLRYRPHLRPALKGVSFRSKPFERIGICGRTGAGKSSIFVALFRMIEHSEGRILIDGVDISRIGLRDLRRRLSIVPQDPVLFNTTIRRNIDPLGKHSDAELWDTLDRVYMREAVLGGGDEARPNGSGDSRVSNTSKKRGAGLDLIVSEGGSNFSSGERQLLSLARAILSGIRVIALDEATASVDPRTDALIQQAVRSHSRNCTIITIAHRLDTIMESDRILVMENGMVIEMDTPERLLEKKDGHLARLVDEMDEIEKRKLKSKVEQSRPNRKD